MPVGLAFLAALNGALYAAWPICHIILAVVFLYDLCVSTGHFSVVRYTLASVSHDRRCTALLLAYAFSGFMEGASGFATPVALSVSMMVGLGIAPGDAMKAGLIGNTVPVAFGALGVPVVTLAAVTRLNVLLLTKAVVRLMLPFALVVPWLVVAAVSPSVRHVLAVWPACLTAGLVQTGIMMLIGEFMGPQLPSLLSMTLTLAALAVLFHFWQPAEILPLEGVASGTATAAASAAATASVVPTGAANSARGPSSARAGPSPDPEAGGSAAPPAPPQAPSLPHTRSFLGQDGYTRAGPIHLIRVKLNPAGKETIDRSNAATGLIPRGNEHMGFGFWRQLGAQTMRLMSVRTLPVVHDHPEHPRHSHHEGVEEEEGSAAGGAGILGHIRAILPAVAADHKAPAVVPVSTTTTLALPTSAAAVIHEDAAIATAAPADNGNEIGPSKLPPAALVPALPLHPHAVPTHIPSSSAAAAAEDHGDHGGHPAEIAAPATHYDILHPPTTREFILGWLPWAVVCVVVGVWGSPDVKAGLDRATVKVHIDHLDGHVFRAPGTPGAGSGAMASYWTVDFVGATGSCLQLIALFTAALYRVPPRRVGAIFARTFRRMALSFATIMFLLAFGYVLRFSGQDNALGVAAAKAGKGFPILSAAIGFLGVALTGSCTTSNVIFGSAQVAGAADLALNPYQMAAANAVAGCLGHVLSTSSMVVAAVAAGESGRDIKGVARRVFPYAMGLLAAMAAWNSIVAYAIPEYLPAGDTAS
jgi:L-lactate permease